MSSPPIDRNAGGRRSVLMHGLTVDAPFDFRAPRSDAAADVLYHCGPAEKPSRSERLLWHDYDSGDWVAGYRGPDESFWLDFSGRHRFLIDRERSRVEANLDASDMDRAHSLAEGWAMATLLQLRGHLVLHTSVVTVDGFTVALLGNSGMGKTTIAAMLCATGGQLVAEDLARIDIAGDLAIAHRGSQALRLRPKAWPIADSIDATATVSDGRKIVDLTDPTCPDTVHLDAIAIPWPDPDCAAVESGWLDPSVAALEISRYPRVFHWSDRTVLTSNFAQLVDLCARVPVAHLRVPWGPPFDLRHTDDIVQTLRSR